MKDATGSVQSAVVLGGTSEIALATLRRLAAGRLRRVALGVSDVASGEAVADDLRALGVDVAVVAFDADDVDSHRRAVGELFAAVGEVDVVLVAHGVLGPPAEEQLEAAVAVARTNFTGAIAPVIPAVRALERQGHGTLVVLSSVAAERPRASNFVYGASKAGLDAFAQGLGDSLAGSGVGVMVVRPGFVRTRMTRHLKDAPLAVGPDDVAVAIDAGLRRGAHTVWAPPAMRWVMLVLRLLPRAVFRRLPI